MLYDLNTIGGKDWYGWGAQILIKHQNERPLGDLFVTMLQRHDIPVQKFGDNTGEFAELLANPKS